MKWQIVALAVLILLCTASLHWRIRFEAERTRDLINKEIPRQIQTNVVELSNQIACQLGDKIFCDKFLLDF